MMKVLRKSKIEVVLDRLAENADIFVPMLRGQMSGFFSWKSYDEDYDDLVLDQLNVYMPPKQVVISPKEKIKIDLDRDSKEPENRIIFGIRGCDLQGIDLLDEYFSTGSCESEFYRVRRDHTIIIANACYYPAPSCFCTSMGVNPTDAPSADVIIRDVGAAGYVWESRSQDGQVLTEKIADLLEEKEVTIPELLPFSLKVVYDGVMEKLKDMVAHPLWEKHSDACQTCGLCTYSCPTCYCFDIQGKKWGAEGYPFLCYDSCMYRDESMMAGEPNLRKAATERFRNRFLHKLQFYPQRFGKPLCTGCGRCVAVCPSGASITKIITEVKGADLSL
jgi:sulfhydrogenase subunit beta (sulfur reductase)